MTTFMAKQTLRGPLADKTNVINMKSSKLGLKIGGSKEVNVPTTPVKKSGRIRKRNILLAENVYQVCTPKIHSTDTANEKILLNRDFAPNNTKLTEAARILDSENIKGVKSPTLTKRSAEAVYSIEETAAETLTGVFQKVLHERDKNTTATKKNQVNNNLVAIEPSSNKETVCAKELVVKIARHPGEVNAAEISYKQRSRRTRTKSILLDETVYHIDKTLKGFTTNFKKVTNENVPKKINSITSTDKGGNTKNKGVDKSTKDSSIGMKELIVGLTPIVNNTLEDNFLIESSIHEDLVVIKPLAKKKYKDKNVENKLKNNNKIKESEAITQGVKNTRKDSDTGNLIGTKELFVKITPLLDVGNITKKTPTIQNRRNRRRSVFHETEIGIEGITNKEMNSEEAEIIKEKNNTKKTPTIQNRRNRRKSVFHETETGIESITNKEMNIEEAEIIEEKNNTKKTPTIQNRRNKRKSVFHETETGIEGITNKEMNSGEAEIIKEKNNTTDPNNLQSPKQLFVNLTQLSNDVKEAERTREEEHEKLGLKSRRPENPRVKFNFTKTGESHNLRNLQAKNYAEESLLDLSINSENPKHDSSNELVLQKEGHIPIYKKNLSDEPASNKNQNDLYEFIDISPKPKTKVKKGARKSSIIFDKNTHEILQKIEEKEAKAVKKCKKKAVVSKPVVKLYNRKVARILSNIKKKISTKNGENTDIVIAENRSKTPTLKTHVHSNENVPSSHTRTIQVNNFNDEMNIIVHQVAIESLNKDKSQARNMENITSRRGQTPLNTNVWNNSHLATDVVREKSNLNTCEKRKETANAKQGFSPSLFDSINICSDSEDDRDDSQENVPLSFEKEVPQRRISAKNMENVTSRRGRNVALPLVSKNSVNEHNLINTFDKLKGSVNDIQSKVASKPSDNVSVSDNQDDIDSCFGFDEDAVPPVASTSKLISKGAINVIVRHRTEYVESPVDFNVRRPNANSTMVHVGTQTRNSSPWRNTWVNARPNSHFISVKSNALPRIDQEPVLEHTLVEGFERRCSKTPRKGTPAKKAPVQQSILSFVESNVETENEPMQGSLYDYEAFTSPVKAIVKGKENQRVETVKRNLMGIKDNIVSSTPVQRKALGDISNSSGEPIFSNSSPEEDSYFGFNESSLAKKAPEKRRNKKPNPMENTENKNVGKPLRIDLSALRSYSAKGRKNKMGEKEKKKVSFEEEEEIQAPDRSISLMEVSNEGNGEEEVHLFEEPEELLDNMSPMPIPGKKHRRKRLDSCEFDTGEQEKKRKRHKKTKLEIEQEEWIEQFNHMCDDIDQHQLEFE